MLRQRNPQSLVPRTTAIDYAAREHDPLLPAAPTLSQPPPPSTTLTKPLKAETIEIDISNMSQKSQWIVLAVASGACAAFNGVFAKLTTTELTTTFATGIANLLHLSNIEKGVEVVIRALFFALNLVFNGIMWTLFTKALARGTSTTQVSILNTSSNFMITAVLGFIIFSESLPPLWFLGAGMLVVGNVIIGRRDEGEKEANVEEERTFSGEQEEGLLAAGRESLELELEEDIEERKRREEEADVLHLGLDEDEGRRSDELR